MSWRILYVESSDTLQLYLDNVKVVKSDQEFLIPISDLHTIILDNYKILLSVHLINALASANVNVVLCGVNHIPNTTIHPISGHSQSPQILKKQINWDSKFKLNMHKLIIKNKISNQIKTLEKICFDYNLISHLNSFLDNVLPGDVNNREGLVSKMYFRKLFGDNFKRFNDDVINAGLNYGYAILRSQISKTIIAKGLNPSLGIFHIGRENLYNLSDDIIEPFRPIIDIWVKQNLMDSNEFTREHRLKIIEQTLVDIKINNQKQTFFNALNMYIDSIVTSFDLSDLSKYLVIELVI